MAPFDISRATPADLQQLKSDVRTVVIKWRASAKEAIFIVKESFPLRLAKAFSSLCRDQAAQQNSQVILITGGNYHAHLSIFDWILRWADGDAAPPQISQKPFLLTFRLRQAAHIIGCQTLADVIERRIKTLANVMPKSEDIEAVYTEFPRGHPARRLTVHSIATAIVGGWAKVADPEMGKLCGSRKDLLEDVNEALPKLYAAKEKYNADQKQMRAPDLESQKAEAARGAANAQRLKQQIEKSLAESRKLKQTREDQQEGKMAEERARRRQLFDEQRAEEHRRSIVSKPATSTLFPKTAPAQGNGKAQVPTNEK